MGVRFTRFLFVEERKKERKNMGGMIFNEKKTGYADNK